MMKQLSAWLKLNLQTILKVAGVIILIVLIFDYVSHANDKAKYERDIAKWKTESTRILKQNDSVRKVVKVLEQKSDSVNKVADDYSAEIARLRSKAPRVVVKEVFKSLPDTCQVVVKALEDEQARGDSLDKALDIAEKRDTLRLTSIALLTKGNGLLKQENDSLKRLVLTVPVYKTPKFLGFIPYPSRKASFVSGAVLGVTSVFVIKNNIR